MDKKTVFGGRDSWPKFNWKPTTPEPPLPQRPQGHKIRVAGILPTQRTRIKSEAGK